MASPWIPTASGRAFELLSPSPVMVDPGDLAEALGKLARYTGHTLGAPYSVAQHSVVVAEQLAEPLPRLYALLHDAHEAYLGDWSTPLKHALALALGARAAEALARLTDAIDAAVHRRFGLAWPPPDSIAEAVKAADRVALATEVRDLLAPPPRIWDGAMPKPLARRLAPWPWHEAVGRWRRQLELHLELADSFPDAVVRRLGAP